MCCCVLPRAAGWVFGGSPGGFVANRGLRAQSSQERAAETLRGPTLDVYATRGRAGRSVGSSALGNWVRISSSYACTACVLCYVAIV